MVSARYAEASLNPYRGLERRPDVLLDCRRQSVQVAIGFLHGFALTMAIGVFAAIPTSNYVFGACRACDRWLALQKPVWEAISSIESPPRSSRILAFARRMEMT